MWYSIQYRIRTTHHGGFLCKKSNLFPVLDIRYRKGGSGRWTSLGSVEIDFYTYRRFKNTYYKSFEKRMTTMMTLETKSDYERLELFMEILGAEFGRSIATLVESVVRERIIMEKADDSEREDVNRITLSLVTSKWETTEIQVRSGNNDHARFPS